MKVFKPVAAQYPISSKYGPRIDPVTKKEDSFHYGTDFKVSVGTPVVAAADGKIFKAGWQDKSDTSKGFGLRVFQTGVVDGKNYQFFYGHLSELSVEEGQEVTAGTRVGLSGNTGKSSGPHLHFEVRPEGGKGIEVEFV
jgi:murein DD-endopeptidase MepM/ murein hydrolase activator NlpD